VGRCGLLQKHLLEQDKSIVMAAMAMAMAEEELGGESPLTTFMAAFTVIGPGATEALVRLKMEDLVWFTSKESLQQ